MSRSDRKQKRKSRADARKTLANQRYMNVRKQAHDDQIRAGSPRDENVQDRM